LKPYPTPTVESTIGTLNALAVLASSLQFSSTIAESVSERMTSTISVW
jgi:hypothetical protein